jgi:hypothetical protein
VGSYLRSVDALEWFGQDEDGFGYLAAAVNAVLERRGLPVYDVVPDEARLARGSGARFKEKLVPPIDTFAELCQEHLTAEEAETLCVWEVLLPISLDPEIWLPIPADSPHESMIAGAPQVLPLAERLAAILELP